MRLWLKITIGIAAGLLLLIGLYLYSLSEVSLKSLSVNKLEDISLKGFTLSGNVELYNGGVLPVKVDHVHYEVILESDNRQLAQGNIKGKWILPKSSSEHRFETKIYWETTAEMIMHLLERGDTYIQIRGSAYIGGLKIQFMKRVNIEEYLKQFAKEKVGEVVGKVVDVVRQFI